MASFAIEEFVGDGVLSGLIPKFVAAGWDDVPTLKMINMEDMELLKLTQQQQEAMELRTYLHDRSLMQYADRMEASKATLTELLSMTTVSLSSQFGMKKGHVSRFVNRENGYSNPKPSSCVPPAMENNVSETSNGSEHNSSKGSLHSLKSHLKLNPNYDPPTAKAVLDLKLNDGHVFKGIVASKPAYPRLCGWIQPPPIVNDVASHSSIANISVQKLTPEYKAGVQRLLENKAPPMKASDLWSNKATVLLCIRRPGCIMCRAEAHQLYSRKPIFDALGFQLVAVLHEQIESEVIEFWPRYWGGLVVVDQTMGFFKALGGGQLLKDKFLTGFILNSHARANYKAAKATGFDQNFKGEGGIKGGMFIIRSGRGGVAYQFIERTFGDWAPIGEVVEICTRIQVRFSDRFSEKLLEEVH
ncbi:uncharacterized protein LOC110099495 isoform X1 [Dendrobium catenatum]|uniref:Peroxiredoxin-like 2A n=1 Tax=Dendrobium catenatum TaxID=906689 RepID=A0A2I0WLE7_9ASPA|nr:uncharacterized protein LOC110099495 isoform X1 [Dendrobium catenatum]XP_020682332.1 uncharacterized protein LOC110099495 isoform X1 [Dendrobium catenatum]PKU76483.1 Thioredoxin-like protein AAED1, chloroplastic [Dendrobium catenatum]